MQNRRLPASERLQQFNDARDGLGIVSPLARDLPFIERPLHINDNQAGSGW
jgi:hypothetical protein